MRIRKLINKQKSEVKTLWKSIIHEILVNYCIFKL